MAWSCEIFFRFLRDDSPVIPCSTFIVNTFVFQVNIFVGLLQSILWLSWSYKNRRRLPHVKWIAGSVLAMDVTILLEVLEFEPILWTFDSHALWHLSTSPIHLATYTFAIEDIKFLVKEKELSEKQKLP